MCLFIKDHNHGGMEETILKHKRTAGRNIKVYKLVVEYGNKFRSQVISFIYESGYHYYNSGGIKPDYNGWSLIIEEALHSYTLPRAVRVSKHSLRAYLIIECIIPKGSTYYFDKQDGEYASDNLIFTGKVINPKKRRIARKKQGGHK